jgi:hypothetical protein
MCKKLIAAAAVLCVSLSLFGCGVPTAPQTPGLLPTETTGDTQSPDPDHTATPSKKPQVSLDDAPKGRLVEIVTAAIGSGDGEVGYGDFDVVASGPPSFAVGDNGDVYILDSYNQRIAVFEDGEWARNIDFSEPIYWGKAMCIDDDSIYMLDYNWGADSSIVKMTLYGEVQGRYVFPRGDYPQNVWKMSVLSGRVAAIAFPSEATQNNWGAFVLDDDTKSVVFVGNSLYDVDSPQSDAATVTLGDRTWEIGRSKSEGFRPLGQSKSGDLYAKCIDDGNGAFFVTIRKYDSNGDLVGYVTEENGGNAACIYIQDNFSVANDGTLYAMLGFEDELGVYRVQWDD